MEFSSKQRDQILQKMGGKEFDLLVIGGGITGAGITYDAVARGMSVALVEMQDFAAGTSSRSTKLVHGGLRYLKQFEVKLVAEVGKERAIVYENGPHVTTPEWMLLPFHKGGTFGAFTTNIGLRLYDFLAGVKKQERRKMLSAAETLEKEPLIKKDGLKGGGYYVEYRTDDARLTIEVMKAAVAHGALAVNYAKAEDYLYENGRITGALVRDQINGKTVKVRAKAVVNATGPWSDKMRDKDAPGKKRLRLTKGVHIVFDQSIFPLRQAIYFDTPDGRMVFAIPRGGKTYVGTTDTFYDKDPVHPKPLPEDIEYLLKAIRFMFPSVKAAVRNVESSWAGVRPLIYEEGKDASEISRKDEIWEGESGLITIAGGKLTGYRKMAETVVDLVAKRLDGNFRPCQTKHLPISGGDVGGSENFPAFIESKSKEGEDCGLSPEASSAIVEKYGTNADQLFVYAKNGGDAGLPREVYALLKYAVEQEMAVKPVDFFIRRTGTLFFDINWVRQWKEPVIAWMGREFSWDSDTEKQYREELEEAIREAVPEM
ncbi:aerobic glycerol-3-phosphate dehydrogenase [Weizmannia acidilactici]|uniref:Glycerol-3-phosphate dehydrogenase n=1 Tax=Weizmannia acidilactici TaxID=2607726 RepID=A0A5J4J8R5_9BACI|nr:glycerol-3-phosphate dehydrogenase/oxidase [Weizmannia acidilactici]GER66703.1 aerobic glycerol-3-phosphate dehydrogenase [Weizmannia acidilactici]GER71256.1 aerobic glycerol-3-phosphate dehydrogenase [Weizmannia acidilactici]